MKKAVSSSSNQLLDQNGGGVKKNTTNEIAHFLRKLIVSHIPRDPHADIQQYEQRINKLLRYLMTIVSSHIAPTHIKDPITFSEIIKKNLIRENRTQDVMRFSDLYRRLGDKRVLNHPWELVYMMHTISHDKTSDSLLISNLNVESLGEPLSKLKIQDKAQNGIVAPTTTSYDAFREYESTSFEVSEEDLLRDVIYTLQGIDGRYVKYDSVADSFQVDPRVGVPRATRDQISKICELGWIYKRVRDFVEAGGFSGGLVLQAFAAAIDHELAYYYKLIAILEQQLTSQAMSLRRLMVWIQEPLERLKLMLILIDIASTRRGASLASELCTLATHGDPFVSKFVRDILLRTCTPIFAFIKAWIFEGILEDPFNEFWVISREEVKIDKLWKSKYSLRKEMIPSFLSTQMAEQILTIGCTINFIRRCCEDTEWQMDSSTIALGSGNLSYDNLTKLETIVSNAAKSTNKRVMELLFKKYKLDMHLTALKQYMLLGQGDFIQHLLELISADLNKPSHSIVRHNLLGILESAIRSSNAQYDDADVTSRLDIRLSTEVELSSDEHSHHQQAANNIGWDMFTLYYVVNSPLDTIFSEDALRVYQRIFKHLWKLKRVDAMLDTTWMKHQELARAFAQNRKNILYNRFASILHKCNLLRHEMVHFCNNLQYYFMFEVVENQWQALVGKINKLQEGGDGDLRALILAHESYVSHIVRQALLSKRQSDVRQQLERTIEVIMQFAHMQEIIYGEAIIAVTTDKMEDEGDDLNSSAFRPDFSVDRFTTKLNEIRRVFKEQQKLFLSMLKASNLQSDSMLQYLTYRLEQELNPNDE